MRRRLLAERYNAALAHLAPVVRPVSRVPHCAPVWHLYVVLVDFDRCGRPRAEIMTHLRSKGIGSQVHYIPVPWQPYYRRLGPMPELPGAERYYGRVLSLPLFPAMRDEDVDRVVDALAEAVGN